MSLDWSVSEIPNWKEVCWVPTDDGKKRLNYVTEAIIFLGLSVDLNGITEKNVDKWAERIAILSQLNDFRLYDTVNGKHTERNPTLAELRAHIGLRTNVSTKTDTKWKTIVWERMMREAKESVRRQKESEDI